MHVLCAGPVLAPGVVIGVVGVGVPVVGGGGVWPAIVAKNSGKEHHSNQDGVGDDEDQHKGKTDEAKQFGLLQFVVLLLGEGLRWGKGGRNSVGTFKQKHGCVCHLLLTNILMIVAGIRQKNPGSQQRSVKINVAATLVKKAYLGRLVVFPVSVCCATPPGWVRTTCVYSVCTQREEDGVKVNRVTSVQAPCHLSHSRGKQAVGSMALSPEVVAGPGLRGAVGVQPVRLEGWKRLELPFSFVPVQSPVYR